MGRLALFPLQVDHTELKSFTRLAILHVMFYEPVVSPVLYPHSIMQSYGAKDA